MLQALVSAYGPRDGRDVRLFTADGTVVQQRFMVQSVVGYGGPTLEDGHAVLLPFSIRDGEVGFGMASTWDVETYDDAHMAFLHRFSSSAFVVAAEPLSVWPSCDSRPAPATAEALASIIAESGHDVTEPVPVSIAGIDGLLIDVAVSGREQDMYLCTFEESGTLSLVQKAGGSRMRLFMVDHPGELVGVVTFAVMTVPGELEDATAEAAPIVDSVEFHLD